MNELITLLKKYGVNKFEATNKRYGNTESESLNILYVDRFFHDHSELP